MEETIPTKKRIDDLVPETVSELEGAVAIALVQKKSFVECHSDVVDCIVRSQDWHKEGYIIYKNVRVYGLGMREASENIEPCSYEDAVLGVKRTDRPCNPYPDPSVIVRVMDL